MLLSSGHLDFCWPNMVVLVYNNLIATREIMERWPKYSRRLRAEVDASFSWVSFSQIKLYYTLSTLFGLLMIFFSVLEAQTYLCQSDIKGKLMVTKYTAQAIYYAFNLEFIVIFAPVRWRCWGWDSSKMKQEFPASHSLLLAGFPLLRNTVTFQEPSNSGQCLDIVVTSATSTFQI